MKNKIVLFFILSLGGFLFSSCQKQDKLPVALIWNIDSNILESGSYQNSVTLINQCNEPLGANWNIYFNQFSSKFELAEDCPLDIKHISGTLFKISPNRFYQPLNVGDSLVVHWQTKRAYVGMSYLPDGAYIVFEKDGKEQTPQTIDNKIIRNDDEYLAQSATGERQYYPFADIVYEENKQYIKDIELKDYDIIPSVKLVEVIEGSSDFVLTKEISIINDPELSNEAEILKSLLHKRYSCSFTDKGTTSIVLSKNTSTKSANAEQYQLVVSDNKVSIDASTNHGIFNGIQTFVSMLGNKSLPIQVASCSITDYPDLLYRGIMLDVSRNFTKKENVLKLIDYLSMYKINKLHLHLADDEGWRVEIAGLEELTDVGARRGHTNDESDRLYPAYGSGWNPDNENSLGNGYYTREDFIEILRYAKSRHMTVIPEIDLPGHSRAAIVAMKARYNKYKDTDMEKAKEYLLTEFADTSKYVSVQNYNDNVISVAQPSTYKFIDKVINEMSQMYQDAGLEMSILHIGGDEVPKGAWSGSPASKELMIKENMQEARELKDYFVAQVLDICRPLNIQIAGWQEIVLKPHANDVDQRFANDNVISYCWNTAPYRKSDEIPYQLANKGFGVILCNAPNFYMDFAYSPDFYEPALNWGGYVDEFCSFNMQPFNIYQSIRRSPNGEPLTKVDKGENKEPLNTKGREYILGVQGQLFSETIRAFDMVTYYLFPKSFGLAERGWNPNSNWIKTQDENDYLSAINLFNTKIGQIELPRLSAMDVNFRIAPPGLKFIDNKLYANTRIKGSEIRYTIDGTEPNKESSLWVSPIEIDALLIKAKLFYIGKESTTVILKK